jgi:hypothetical protein
MNVAINIYGTGKINHMYIMEVFNHVDRRIAVKS